MSRSSWNMFNIFWVFKAFGFWSGLLFFWHTIIKVLGRPFDRKRIELHSSFVEYDFEEALLKIKEEEKQEAYQRVGITLH
jgi:hypothetical protein